MSDIDHQPEELQEKLQDQSYKLQIRFRKEIILEVSLLAQESFLELRGLVAQLPDLFFHSNFHFQHEGKKINE